MEEKTIQVGNSIYPLVKMGRAQAKQVAQLTKWLKKYGLGAFESLQNKMGEGGLDTAAGIQVLLEFLGSLSDDALIEAYVFATGCTIEEADNHFDIEHLVDVISQVYNEQPSIRRLVERFFSAPSLTETTPESSTTSE